eukprot:3946382-Prorocentrum_lima.AAC.1
MDLRDQWVGIKALKKQYAPTPYSRREGLKHVGTHQIAKEAAIYLRNQQWSTAEPFDRQRMPP